MNLNENIILRKKKSYHSAIDFLWNTQLQYEI